VEAERVKVLPGRLCGPERGTGTPRDDLYEAASISEAGFCLWKNPYFTNLLHQMRTTVSLLLYLLATLTAGAQPSLDEIVQKRDAVLTQLLEIAKSDMKSGRRTQEDVYEALIRLYSFRRDSAKTLSDRIKWQEQVVSAEQQVVTDTNARMAIGVMGPVDVLRAEERLLTAQQKLAELRLEK
jgi:hypothetical protein